MGGMSCGEVSLVHGNLEKFSKTLCEFTDDDIAKTMRLLGSEVLVMKK